MFYDINGKVIREGSVVEFGNEEYTIVRINGDRMGLEGTSSLTFDRKPQGNEMPCELNVTLVTY